MIGVTQDVSTLEGLAAHAHALHKQMQTAQINRSVCIDKPDVITYLNMRALRRQATKMFYALENANAMPLRRAYPNITVEKMHEAHTDQHGHEVDAKVTFEPKNAKDVISELVTAYKQSIFIKDRGRVISEHRPERVPLLAKISEGWQDALLGLKGFGRQHPIQCLAIATSILILKLLFAVAIFDAIAHVYKAILHDMGFGSDKTAVAKKSKSRPIATLQTETQTWPPPQALPLQPLSSLPGANTQTLT